MEKRAVLNLRESDLFLLLAKIPSKCEEYELEIDQSLMVF